MVSWVARHIHVGHDRRPYAEFINLRETVKAAREAGLSVGEFIERRRCPAGETPLERTINAMAVLGVFGRRPQRVCEIGPGSGRYLERVIALCKPDYYEIYETAHEWRRWLASRYPVTVKHCDGRTLSDTPPESIQLVQAHKVFPGTAFLVTVGYLCEMARVVSPGGFVVFDVMTERCFTQDRIAAWEAAGACQWDWCPHVMPSEYTVHVLRGRGLSLVGRFEVPLYPAFTDCFVFKKECER
jgi:hypothetical protein